MEMEAAFVVIGGGIAGVTCTETLAFLQPEKHILLISESSLIKTVTNLLAVTQTLTKFDIEEKSISTLSDKYANVTVIHDKLTEIDAKTSTVRTLKGNHISYKYLCLCMGAKPKIIPEAADNPHVLSIRDTDSVDNFIKKLSSAKKIAIVGNGGIASELIYKIRNTEIDWIIRDNHITATFIDPGAAEFFQTALETKAKEPGDVELSKRMRYHEEGAVNKSGAALGPDWYRHLDIVGANFASLPIKIHYKAEITHINMTLNEEMPLEVVLSNEAKLHCDFIVSATGIEPQLDFAINANLDLSEEGINVDEFMQTSLKNIFAAGDICCAKWQHSKTWFQMKLWTQARQMGSYAAKSMSATANKEAIFQDFCFELFTHSTKLFGHKVVLIGLYNGQKLGSDYEILLRMTKGVEYVKFVLQNHKLLGAVLIGDTDLEETVENLILNEIDLSLYKEDLLNPDVDIEDYFD